VEDKVPSSYIGVRAAQLKSLVIMNTPSLRLKTTLRELEHRLQAHGDRVQRIAQPVRNHG
jgi:hypothetical protein